MLRKIFRRLKNIIKNIFIRKTNILDQYIVDAPSPQRTIDIFKDEWSSKFPDDSGFIGGNITLYDDERIKWAIKLFNGVDDKTILELGPLEAGHTYMLHNQNAKSIIGVEANTRAFLKCLIVKELFKLSRANFLCGDFIKYMHQSDKVFDITIASGVLYHMANPVELIELISKCTNDAVFVWTHYYDEQLIKPLLKNNKNRFVESIQFTHAGFSHVLHKQQYLKALGWQGFCGGSNDYSYWLTRQDIIDAFKHFGFKSFEFSFEDEKHPNGPAFAFVAYK